jgi:Na+/H+-dicarboxylate symporter
MSSQEEDGPDVPDGMQGVIFIGLLVGTALGFYFGGNILTNMIYSGASPGAASGSSFLIQAGFMFGTPIVFGAIYAAIAGDGGESASGEESASDS